MYIIRNMEKLYYKITNKNENHYGFQYIDGLNILKDEFNDWSQSCNFKGLYFTNVKNIFKFLDYGCYVREVKLPIDNPNFKMVKVGSIKWRANMIILGNKYNLNDHNTFDMLIKNGAQFINNALEYASINGYIEIIKLLVVKYGVKINSLVLNFATKNGNFEVVKFLIQNGAQIDNLTLRYALDFCNLEIIKFLIENGAQIDNNHLMIALNKNNLEIIKLLIQYRAKIDENYLTLLITFNNIDPDIIEYILKNKAIININHGIYIKLKSYILSKYKDKSYNNFKNLHSNL